MATTPLFGGNAVDPVTIQRVETFEIHKGDIHASIIAKIDLKTGMATFMTVVSALDSYNQRQVNMPIPITTIDLETFGPIKGYSPIGYASVLTAFEILTSEKFQAEAAAKIKEQLKKIQFDAAVAEAKTTRIKKWAGD